MTTTPEETEEADRPYNPFAPGEPFTPGTNPRDDPQTQPDS